MLTVNEVDVGRLLDTDPPRPAHTVRRWFGGLCPEDAHLNLTNVEQGDPFISAAQSPCGLTDTLRSFSVTQ